MSPRRQHARRPLRLVCCHFTVGQMVQIWRWDCHRDRHRTWTTIRDYTKTFISTLLPASSSNTLNHTTSTVARALMVHVFSRFGSPRQLLTDRGSEFESELYQELMKWMEIYKMRTTVFHPSCNGVVERFDITLNSMLAKTVNDVIRSFYSLALIGNMWIRCDDMAIRHIKTEEMVSLATGAYLCMYVQEGEYRCGSKQYVGIYSWQLLLHHTCNKSFSAHMATLLSSLIHIATLITRYWYYVETFCFTVTLSIVNLQHVYHTEVVRTVSV